MKKSVLISYVDGRYMVEIRGQEIKIFDEWQDAVAYLVNKFVSADIESES